MSDKIKLLVPKETVNIIRNPSGELNLEDWAAIGSGISRSPNEARFGWNSVRVFTNDLDPNEGVYVRSFPNTLDTIYTGSIYVKGQGRVRLRMRDGTNGLDFPGEFVNLETDPELEVPACEPNSLVFNGATSLVNCQSDGRIDDLADNAFTAEAWVLLNDDSAARAIFDKRGAAGAAGWALRFSNFSGLNFRINAAAQDALSQSGFDDFSGDGIWHHVAVTYDDAGTREGRIWIDGIEVSYPTQDPAIGAIVTDVAANLIIGRTAVPTWPWDGSIGWSRISDNLRYTANFTPPGRCALPEIDANTIAQWIGVEQDGEGSLVENQEGDPNLDGTESNTTVGCDCTDPARGKKWRRLSVSGKTGDALSDDLRLVVETDQEVEAVFYVDGAQIEEGELTTYCDGDQPGCRWNGTFHDSTSQRNNPEFREGGVITPIPMIDPDLYVTISSGLGMPPIRQIFQELAILPGSVFERSKALSRTIDLTFWARNLLDKQPCFPASIDRLNEIRQALIDVIKPDVTKDQQPFVLFYEAEQGTVFTSVRYDSGLEYTGDLRNPYFNSFNMRTIAESPFWNEDDQNVRVLRQSDVVDGDNRIIARIEGEWQQLGDGAADGEIFALAVAPNGDIYATGAFQNIGGIAANRIARWDGENWFPLGAGLDDDGIAVTVHPDGRVFVTGDFLNAGGGAAVRIAEWDPGTETWTALGAGVDGQGRDLAIGHEGSVYVVGAMANAGGNPARGAARWDGGLWHSLNGSVNTPSGTAVAIHPDGSVYVGGAFTAVGPAFATPARAIARFVLETGVWSALGEGLNGTVRDIKITTDGIVYVYGQFDVIADPLIDTIAFWNGSAWFGMGKNLNATNATEIAISPEGAVWVGGTITAINGIFVDDLPMAFWNGSIWTPPDLIFPAGARVEAILFVGDDLYLGLDDSVRIDVSAVTTIFNPGTASIFPRFRFIGPGKLIWLENLSTDDVIYFDYDAIESEEVVIDLREQIKTMVSNFRGNVVGNVRPNSDFAAFSLLPGNNNIKVFITNEVPETQFQISLGTRHWSFDGVAG